MIVVMRKRTTGLILGLLPGARIAACVNGKFRVEGCKKRWQRINRKEKEHLYGLLVFLGKHLTSISLKSTSINPCLII